VAAQTTSSGCTNDIVLADISQVVSRELVERIVDEGIAKVSGQPGDYLQARATFKDGAIGDDFAAFLNLPADERIP
jgi:malate synthase